MVKVNRHFKFFFIVLAASLLLGCSPAIRYSWHHENLTETKYNRILVAAIVQSPNAAYRRQAEEAVIHALQRHGYNAVAASQEYGERGLAALSEEETYLKLCSAGIDAVLTVVLVDRQKEGPRTPGNTPYTNTYYYSRIWKYRTIAAAVFGSEKTHAGSNHIYWESMLFDLRTLEPVYILQSRRFYPGSPACSAYRDMMLQYALRKGLLTRLY